MVKRLMVATFLAGAFALPAGAFEKVDGPRFFNSTRHNIQLRATFANGDVFPITLIPGAMGIYWDAQQVKAIDAVEGDGREVHLSGAMLPHVPPGLSRPYDQIWMIDDDGGICVLPHHNFDLKRTKC